MNVSEREIILRGWEDLENESIVKDVATKGKFINLSIQFLSKRMSITLEETKLYFTEAVNRYVERLLSNRQVYKAEHVLKNVNRNPKFFFYEMACEHETVRSDLMDHLRKTLSDDSYENEISELDSNYRILNAIKSNKSLAIKYKNDFSEFSLEAFDKKDKSFVNDLKICVFFQTQSSFLAEQLDKHLVWTYLVRERENVWLLKWLDTLYSSSCGENDGLGTNYSDSSFDEIVASLFVKWPIDHEIMEYLNANLNLLNESLLNALAKIRIFTEEERNNVVKVLHRIFATETWNENKSFVLESDLYRTQLTQLILNSQSNDHNILSLLIEDFVDTNLLAGLNTSDNKELELAAALKPIELTDVAELSPVISNYILKSDGKFLENNISVYLGELFLHNLSVEEILDDNEKSSRLKRIPFLNNVLEKLQGSQVHLNDYKITIYDLVKQYRNVDLKQIQHEAGNEPLSFFNKPLISKYGQPTKLNYIHYIRQYRSSYAVYVFLVDQLQTYSHISKAQINLACSAVVDLALSNYQNRELFIHCIGFVEMLGINTTCLRSYLKCLKLAGVFEGVTELKNNNLHDLLEKKLLQKLINQQFDSRDLDAVKCVYDNFEIQLPKSFLLRIASSSNWFQFILFATYFHYSIEQILQVCDEAFPHCDDDQRQILTNLMISVREDCTEQDRCRRSSSLKAYREHRKMFHNNKHDSNLCSTSEIMTSSLSSGDTTTVTSSKLNPAKYLPPNVYKDLIAIILQSTIPEELAVVPAMSAEVALTLQQFRELQKPSTTPTTTALALLQNSLKLKWPLLSVLSATVNDLNVQWCWFSWLQTSVDAFEIDANCTGPDELYQNIFEFCVRNGYIRTLHQSILIFYPENKLKLFTEFLSRTSYHDFGPDVSALLKQYLISINDDESSLFLKNDPNDLLSFIIMQIVHHLTESFDSMEHRRLLLNSLCDSGISDFINVIDFNILKSINEIICFTSVPLNIDLFMRNKYSDLEIANEYERICESLLTEKEFQKAMELADLLTLSKDNILYEKWVHDYEADKDFDLNRCECETEEHSLKPELVISFYIHVADKITYEDPKKYKILKKILDVIKKHRLFPSASFDRDRIEYEMILSFLKNSMPITDLDVYNSEYFETVMSEERYVLYKTFLELKETADIEDLSVCNKMQLDQLETLRLEDLINLLLDQGDIAQALRIQSIFNHRPLDLHFLVFCMALAEDLASLSDLSHIEREMLNEGVKVATSKFNRRTLLKTKKRPSLSSASSSPTTKINYFETSDISSGALEFEEIPPRDKQDVLEAIQSLAARVKHGIKIGHRIAMTYRAAMYLDKSYVEVLRTKDPFILLENAIDDNCLSRLVVMSDIMTSMEMTNKEVADFLAEQMATNIITARFYLIKSNNQLHSSPQNVSIHSNHNILWGYDLDKEFRLFLELCPNTSMLGNALLQYCDALKLYRKNDLINGSGAESSVVSGESFSPGTEGHNLMDDVMETSSCSNESGLLLTPTQAYVDNDQIKAINEKLKIVMDNKILSHKKQNTINVELLIKAHECFVHECYMEGIAVVLQRAKSLNGILTRAKSWSLIVKMLMGIGRYRDMYYCFETLIKNDQFESLLGQFDEEGASGLKQAIISYLNENYPENHENYRLAALHFLMYSEIAHMWECEAKAIIDKIIADCLQKPIPLLNINAPAADVRLQQTSDQQQLQPPGEVYHLKCSSSLVAKLTAAMESYAQAAENYLLDNKLNLAQTTANTAELVALQINLVYKALEKNNSNAEICVCVLDLRTNNNHNNNHIFKQLVNNELSVPQAQILSRAYSYDINWIEAIFNQFVVLGNEHYIYDFCDRMELTEHIIETLVKSFQHQQNVTAQMEKSIKSLVEMVQSVTLRYKLASLLGLRHIAAQLINEQSEYFLRDTNFGRNEINF